MKDADVEAGFTPRQREVLSAALEVMVGEADRLTMAHVARRAKCSKETLYKWFGDRQGLLTATVQWQAAKVQMPRIDPETMDAATLKLGLQAFAASWLSVLSSDISIALNRLAVGQAGAADGGLGPIVLTNGPFAMARRLEPLFRAARRAALLAFDDENEAFRSFFGLVVRDMQIRLLLGDQSQPSPASLQLQAQRAVDQFLRLYGVTNHANIKTNSTQKG